MLDLSAQPSGLASRRPKDPKYAKALIVGATKNFEQGFITEQARNYQIGFAEGSLPRQKRPQTYPWLTHRWGSQLGPQRIPVLYGGDSLHVRHVVVQDIPGNPLPMADDDGDQALIGAITGDH